jgi:hypothetical protein
VTVASAHLRSGAGTNFGSIGLTQRGDDLIGSDGFIWNQVRMTSDHSPVEQDGFA